MGFTRKLNRLQGKSIGNRMSRRGRTIYPFMTKREIRRLVAAKLGDPTALPKRGY